MRRPVEPFTALAYAQQHDVFVVIASGNESASVPSYPAAYSGDLSNAISVGAYDSNHRRANFSNKVGNSGALQVDMPGVGIYSTVSNGRYARYSGTSMASPHLAGTVALMLSANPALTSPQIQALLTASATRAIANSDSVGGVNSADVVYRSLLAQSGSVATTASGAAGQGSGVVVRTSSYVDASVVPAALDQAFESVDTIAPIRRFVDANVNNFNVAPRQKDLEAIAVTIASDETPMQRAKHESGDGRSLCDIVVGCAGPSCTLRTLRRWVATFSLNEGNGMSNVSDESADQNPYASPEALDASVLSRQGIQRDSGTLMLDFALTEQDYYDYFYFNTFKLPSSRSLFWRSYLGPPLFFFAAAVLFSAGRSLLAAGILCGMALGLLVIYPFLVPFRLKKRVRQMCSSGQYLGVVGPRRMNLSERGVLVYGQSGEFLHYWAGIVQIIESRKLLLLYVGYAMAIVVPRRSFLDSDEYEEFVAYLTQHASGGDCLRIY
ncbi:MAG: S8 family serine peptidase [Pirellulaceae bacterium]